MNFNDFINANATKDAHNDGAKLFLDDKKEQYLLIYGPDSDIGRQVEYEKYRIDPKKQDVPSELKRLFAKLVRGWSIDEPVREDLVETLFTQCPWIYDKVINFFQKRANFPKGRLKS